MNKFSIGSGFASASVQEFVQSQLTEDTPTPTNLDNNQITGDDGTIYVLDSAGDVKESSKPTVKGQFKKPGLWRYGEPRAVVLHLDKADDLAQYNNILAGASGEDPNYYILESTREFWQGSFIVMLTWCPVLYASLMRKTK